MARTTPRSRGCRSQRHLVPSSTRTSVVQDGTTTNSHHDISNNRGPACLRVLLPSRTASVTKGLQLLDVDLAPSSAEGIAQVPRQ